MSKKCNWVANKEPVSEEVEIEKQTLETSMTLLGHMLRWGIGWSSRRYFSAEALTREKSRGGKLMQGNVLVGLLVCLFGKRRRLWWLPFCLI